LDRNNSIGTESKTPLLDHLGQLYHIKDLSLAQLEQLSTELRYETIEAVSETGGHLGAGLGVIELTIALHHVFDTPDDLLVWDIGHQSYPHKILTGRRNQIRSIRKPGGLSGFTKRAESIYDVFGAGHSSTSISAALGMAVARDFNHQKKEVIAVIGDGAMSAGMAYEAMNNAGWLNNRLIVILNDNDMSIAPPVGGMSNYLSRLISSSQYLNFRNMAKQVFSHLPKPIEEVARKAERYAKAMANNGNFFEELGFYYVGPMDGHNLSHLVPILSNIKDDQTINRPVLLHIVTEKGRGFHSNESCQEKFHAVNKFDLTTGIQVKSKPLAPTYTKVFGEFLTKEAEKDDKIIAITAAMPSGTGLNIFADKFPTRMIDVGIAEQHAVTFAAGLACEGMKPFVAIYSTFLQRAYDQIVHDVVLQKLPVRFAIDRAGYVGADGPTHAGSFDITYLATLPNIILMAPSNENELRSAILTSVEIDDMASAFRYPRGESTGAKYQEPQIFQIGKGRIIRSGSDVAILSLGTRLEEALRAADNLSSRNISVTVADARFAKPIDCELIKNLVDNHELLITIEEGAIGGFGSHVMNYIYNDLNPSKGFKIRTLFMPDYFIDHNNVDVMYNEAGLDAANIEQIVLQLIKKPAMKKVIG
jgi:1-deoxy-D-xylulose-5-phosphate synthase